MNKIFKVVWSKVRNSYVVVSEVAKSSGKSGVKSIAAAAAAAVLMSGGTAMAAELPTDGSVVTDGTYEVTGETTILGHKETMVGKAAYSATEKVTVTMADGTKLYISTDMDEGGDLHGVIANTDIVGGNGTTVTIETTSTSENAAALGHKSQDSITADNITVTSQGSYALYNTQETDKHELTANTKIMLDSKGRTVLNGKGTTNMTASEIEIKSDRSWEKDKEDTAITVNGAGAVNINTDTLKLSGGIDMTYNDNAMLNIKNKAGNDAPQTIKVDGNIKVVNGSLTGMDLSGTESYVKGTITANEKSEISFSDGATWYVKGDSSMSELNLAGGIVTTDAPADAVMTLADDVTTEQPDLTISNTGANDYGIHGYGDVKVEGVLDITSGDNAIYAQDGTLNVTAGEIDIDANGASYGDPANGLYAQNADLNVTADSLTINAEGHGINAGAQAGNSIVVDTTGKATINAGENGIYTHKDGTDTSVEVNADSIEITSAYAGSDTYKGHAVAASSADSSITLAADTDITLTGANNTSNGSSSGISAGNGSTVSATAGTVNIEGYAKGDNHGAVEAKEGAEITITATDATGISITNNGVDSKAAGVVAVGSADGTVVNLNGNIEVNAVGGRGVKAVNGYDSTDTSATVNLGDSTTENITIKDAFIGLGAHYNGSQINVEGDNLTIEDATGYGVYAINGHVTDANAADNAKVTISADTATKITMADNSYAAIAATSQSTVDIAGDLDVDAGNTASAIATRGNSVININKDGGSDVNIVGDIRFQESPSGGDLLDAVVNINLTEEGSSLTGNVYTADKNGNADFTLAENTAVFDKTKSGLNLGLAEGTTYTTDDDSMLLSLDMTGGEVKMTSTSGSTLDIGTLKGTDGTFTLSSVDSTVNIGTAADDVALTVAADGSAFDGDVREALEQMQANAINVTNGADKVTVESAALTDTAIRGEVALDNEGKLTTTIDTDELVVTGNITADNITALETKTDNIQSDLSDLNTEVINTNAELQKTNANVSALNGELVKTNKHFNAELGKTNEQVEANANNIAANSQAIQNNSNAIAGLGQGLNSLSNRVDRVGAGAAALAALHPLDYDAENKLSFSAGVGNYAGATAAAIGAFYRPNEDVLFSIGGTAGNGENMINAGVSFAIGKGSSGTASLSKVELVNKVQQMEEKYEAVEAENKELRNEINELKAMVMELAAKK